MAISSLTVSAEAGIVRALWSAARWRGAGVAAHKASRVRLLSWRRAARLSRGRGRDPLSKSAKWGVPRTVKKGIHPPMGLVQFRCASCSNRWVTSSTRLKGKAEEFEGAEYPTIVLETCSNCHPFFTEKQSFIDTAGRVEKFQKRFGKFTQKQDEGGEAKKSGQESAKQ